MTVNIVLYDYSLIGGAEKVAINLANELSNYYSVNLISVFSANEKPISEINKNVNIFVLDKNVNSITMNLFKYSKKIKNILDDGENTIISITAGLNTIVKLASRGTRSKIYYAEHSNLKNSQYGWKHKLRQRIGAKSFDGVISLTEDDKKEFVNHFGISEKKVHVIYNWVEEPSNKSSIQYDVNSKTIVSLGRVVPVKGYDRAVRIAKKVFEKHPDWIWEIFGGGDDFENIKAMISDNNLEDNLLLKGFTTNIDESLRNKSIFVSTSSYEGFPISFLEAREYSLPIISFNCPTGPKEIVNDGIDGFLVEPYDENEMTKDILNLIDNEELRIKMSQNIQKSQNRFSKHNIIKQWIQLIGEENNE